MARPLAWLWQQGAEFRRRRFDAGRLRAQSVDCPVISVGGIEVGGSGKSPVTAYVLQVLRNAGYRPGLLTRGYKRKTRGLIVRQQGEAASAEGLGDEACMMVQQGLDVPVAAVSRRIDGARALRALGCNVVVLDDGFVHRALARDIDIVVLSGDLCAPHLSFVPAGRLREVPAALRRAHLIWWHDKGRKGTQHHAMWQAQFAGRYAQHTPVVRSRATLSMWQDASGNARPLARQRVVAACGIARPHSFVAALEEAGAEVAATAFFADHAPANARRLREAERLSAHHEADVIAVTAKDWASWQHEAARARVPIGFCPQTFDLSAADARCVKALLSAAMRQQHAAD